MAKCNEQDKRVKAVNFVSSIRLIKKHKLKLKKSEIKRSL